jgi:hypothetical protein
VSLSFCPASFSFYRLNLMLQVLAPDVASSLSHVSWPSRHPRYASHLAEQSAAPDRKKRHSTQSLTTKSQRRFLRQVSLAFCRARQRFSWLALGFLAVMVSSREAQRFCRVCWSPLLCCWTR